MGAPSDGVLTIEDATIIFRNFAGRETQYNAKGDRNFSLILDDRTLVEQLRADGWNVKLLKARDPEDEDRFHVPVAVSYKFRPPRVTIITSGGRTPLHDEEMVSLVDAVDIDVVDLTVRGNPWAVSGNTGRKAYLQTMFVRIREDPLDLKYADIPIIGASDDPLAIDNTRAALELGTAPHYDFEGDVVDD